MILNLSSPLLALPRAGRRNEHCVRASPGGKGETPAAEHGKLGREESPVAGAIGRCVAPREDLIAVGQRERVVVSGRNANDALPREGGDASRHLLGVGVAVAQLAVPAVPPAVQVAGVGQGQRVRAARDTHQPNPAQRRHKARDGRLPPVLPVLERAHPPRVELAGGCAAGKVTKPELAAGAVAPGVNDQPAAPRPPTISPPWHITSAADTDAAAAPAAAFAAFAAAAAAAAAIASATVLAVSGLGPGLRGSATVLHKGRRVIPPARHLPRVPGQPSYTQRQVEVHYAPVPQLAVPAVPKGEELAGGGQRARVSRAAAGRYDVHPKQALDAREELASRAHEARVELAACGGDDPEGAEGEQLEGRRQRRRGGAAGRGASYGVGGSHKVWGSWGVRGSFCAGGCYGVEERVQPVPAGARALSRVSVRLPLSGRVCQAAPQLAKGARPKSDYPRAPPGPNTGVEGSTRDGGNSAPPRHVLTIVLHHFPPPSCRHPPLPRGVGLHAPARWQQLRARRCNSAARHPRAALGRYTTGTRVLLLQLGCIAALLMLLLQLRDPAALRMLLLQLQAAGRTSWGAPRGSPAHKAPLRRNAHREQRGRRGPAAPAAAPAGAATAASGANTARCSIVTRRPREKVGHVDGRSMGGTVPMWRVGGVR
eukprot:scaffold15718_cov107-Isochrysis_galbana.AAC.3